MVMLHAWTAVVVEWVISHVWKMVAGAEMEIVLVLNGMEIHALIEVAMRHAWSGEVERVI
jgi:hypothetical protein